MAACFVWVSVCVYACACACTVHVTSYLQKSEVFRGNPLWICVKSVRKFADRLWQAHRIVVGDSLNCLSGICGIVFCAPMDSSYGSPPNDLWETAGYRVCEIVFGSPQIAVQSPSNFPQQSFSGTFRRYARRFHGYPAMFLRIICDGWFTEVCKLPRGNLQKPTLQICEISN